MLPPPEEAELLHCRKEQECRGRSPLPEREVSSLLFLSSPPQAEKSKNATALPEEGSGLAAS